MKLWNSKCALCRTNPVLISSYRRWQGRAVRGENRDFQPTKKIFAGGGDVGSMQFQRKSHYGSRGGRHHYLALVFRG